MCGSGALLVMVTFLKSGCDVAPYRSTAYATTHISPSASVIGVTVKVSLVATPGTGSAWGSQGPGALAHFSWTRSPSGSLVLAVNVVGLVREIGWGTVMSGLLGGELIGPV